MTYLRKVLRKVLSIETKLVLRKHKPYVIAILGEKDSSYIREIIYAIVKSDYNARRNLEKTNSEFSIPLTVFGELKYPESDLAWLRIILKTLLQLIYIRPYKHHLILQLHEIEPYILKHWLKIINPNLIIVTDKLDVGLQEITKEKQVIYITANDIENIKDNSVFIKKLSQSLHIPQNEIIKQIKSSKPINPRINILAGKNKNIIIDARYYYYPISMNTISEITDLMPGNKYVVGNVENIRLPHNYHALKPEEIDVNTKESVFIFIGPKTNHINDMRRLALNELEI